MVTRKANRQGTDVSGAVSRGHAGAFDRFRLPGAVRWAAIVAVIGPLLASCGDGNGNVVDATAGTPPVVESDREAGVVAIVDGRFEPDFIEVVQGARITIRNDTDASVSIALAGTNSEEAEVREVDPGGSFELQLDVLGAQVLTLADKPDATGSIMVIADEASR